MLVAPWVYHPGCGIGGGVLCYGLLVRLAERYDVHWISFDHTVKDLEGGKALLRGLCASVTTLPLPRRRFKLLWLAQLLGGPPVEAEFARSEDIAAAIRERVRACRAEAVVCQFPETAQYLVACPDVPAVMDTQDVWTVSRFREWRSRRGLARVNGFLTWLSWARHELKHYGRAAHLVALSENDAGVLRSMLPGVPCTLSPVAFEAVEAAHAGGGPFVMVGNYAHAPNADGLAWLLREVWPRLRRLRPEARLRVIGPACPPALPGEAEAGVERLGFVPDLAAHYRDATAALIPYRFGGGVKIKAIEAMAHGCPVVATPVGAEGIGLAPGVDGIVAADPDGFAAAMARLCADPAAALATGAAGRRLVEARFSFDAKLESFSGAIEAAVAGHAARPAEPRARPRPALPGRLIPSSRT